MAAREQQAASIVTLPNLLGIGRIVATPIVMALLLADGAGTDLLAAVLFVAAALSDILDGWIARSRDEVTPLGVFMDLAADKVLVAGVLVAMVAVGLVPVWIAATILIREFVVQAVRQLAAAEDVVISARSLGKAKTLATNAGLAVLFLVLIGLPFLLVEVRSRRFRRKDADWQEKQALRAVGMSRAALGVAAVWLLVWFAVGT